MGEGLYSTALCCWRESQTVHCLGVRADMTTVRVRLIMLVARETVFAGYAHSGSRTGDTTRRLGMKMRQCARRAIHIGMTKYGLVCMHGI